MEHTDQQGNGRYSAGPIWKGIRVLIARWRTIAIITIAVGLLAVGIALLLPREYSAEARVLRPEGGGLTSLLGLNTAAGGLGRALLGGGSSDYIRYLTIMNSRSMRVRIVDEFDLIQVYGVADKRHPMESALTRLDKNLEFRVSMELQHLSVYAFDRDAERAASIANFVVAELNQQNAHLTSENARQSREYIEARLQVAHNDLEQVRGEIQDFQESHGIVELESQAQAFLSSVAEQSGRMAQIEVQYESLRAQYGSDNPRVQAALGSLAAARRQLSGALGGREALMPVSLREMPALSRRYAELLQEQMIQIQVLESIYPLYEQAQFQERLETQAVQVLDPAVVPIQPARPSRRLIVAIALMTALFLSSAYVLAMSWISENKNWLLGELQPGRIASSSRITQV